MDKEFGVHFLKAKQSASNCAKGGQNVDVGDGIHDEIEYSASCAEEPGLVRGFTYGFHCLYTSTPGHELLRDTGLGPQC